MFLHQYVSRIVFNSRVGRWGMCPWTHLSAKSTSSSQKVWLWPETFLTKANSKWSICKSSPISLLHTLKKTLKYFYHFSWMDSWIPTPFNLAERLIASLMKCFTSELLKKYKCIPNNSFYWLMVSLCYQWNTNLVNSGRQRVSSHINGINPATKQSGNN